MNTILNGFSGISILIPGFHSK